MPLTDEEKISCLRLLMSENIGPITYHQLLTYYGTAKEAIKHVGELSRRGGRKKEIVVCSEQKAAQQLELAEKNGASVIFKQEPIFPKLLKQLPDAAPALFIRGNMDAFLKKSVAIVGTRNASINGKALTRKLAYDLAESGYNIVSGLAHGIDRAAHMGALGSPKEAATTAVLGTPVNEIYPVENTDIYEQILERGCLVSEFPFGTQLNPRNFPRRNRIISGLALGTLVIEAQEKSGSLITAHEAADQGREVMAVPGSPTDPRSEGPNALIRDGATLVRSADDIMAVLEQDSFRLKEKETPIVYQTTPVAEDTLNEARELVKNNLSTDIISVDDLIRETGLDTRVINIILVELDVAGRLERYPGNRISMIYSRE